MQARNSLVKGKEPLVSVVMIFLNAGQFIQEAIESVFAQTYPAWELLLVDDGSTDESTAIARSYSARYAGRVFYFEHDGHQNCGMSASRNLGITNARGEYLAFLDADDVWLPGKLDQQIAVLEDHPEAGMVYGPAQWWFSWTGDPEDQPRDYIHHPGVPLNTLLRPPELLIRFLRTEGISPCTCSVLVRRNTIEKVNGFEERFRGLYEDQVFFAKISLADNVWVTPNCSARYRQHPNSNFSKTQNTGEHPAARLKFLTWLSAYVSERGIQDGPVRKALWREMLPYRFPILYRLNECLRSGLPGRANRFVRKLSSHWLSLPVARQLRTLQFRRLRPLGDGRQRGTAVVRYYWDHFLQQHQADIQGAALEIGTTSTVRLYGGQAITHADAIDLAAHSPEITLVADLSRADHLPGDVYDCFVNQFSMHLIYDVEAALFHSVRLLKPGGVLLVNFPCVDYYFPRGLDMGTGEPLYLYWWFTPIQVENLLRRIGLDSTDYTLEIYGNLFSRLAYQLNLPAEELTRQELEHRDPGHPLLICARVVKPAGWKGTKPSYRDSWKPAVQPAVWNPETGHYTG